MSLCWECKERLNDKKLVSWFTLDPNLKCLLLDFLHCHHDGVKEKAYIHCMHFDCDEPAVRIFNNRLFCEPHFKLHSTDDHPVEYCGECGRSL